MPVQKKCWGKTPTYCCERLVQDSPFPLQKVTVFILYYNTFCHDFQFGELDTNQKNKAATLEEPETELSLAAKDMRLVKGKSMPSLRWAFEWNISINADFPSSMMMILRWYRRTLGAYEIVTYNRIGNGILFFEYMYVNLEKS